MVTFDGAARRVATVFRPCPVPTSCLQCAERDRGGSVDALFRPIPFVWGFRPYLLGGLGIATLSPSGSQVVEAGEEPTVIRVIPIARTTALERNPAQRVDGANDTRSTSRMVVAEISPSTSS